MRCVVFFLLLLACSPILAQESDTAICNRAFSFAFEHKLIDKPLGKVSAEIGKQFIGKPYEAHTLDASREEKLVCNLHSFDCVTFVENTLALAKCVKANRMTYDAYRQELAHIRYRGGILSGYSSRLHYFSEWIHENELKGIVQEVTMACGGVPYVKTINFMTTHRSAYPQLAQDSIFRQVQSAELRFASHAGEHFLAYRPDDFRIAGTR